MIIGVGLDVAQISRFRPKLEDARFMQRIYTPAERELIAGSGEHAAARAAGCFAAKEALAKALGCGIGLCPPDSVAVLRADNGRPYIRVLGAAQHLLEQAGAKNVYVSITNTGDIAAAVVILEG